MARPAIRQYLRLSIKLPRAPTSVSCSGTGIRSIQSSTATCPSPISRHPAHSTSSSLTVRRSYQTSTTTKPSPNFAFAFDIDGVLLRSSTPLRGARESLLYLKQNSIPFILLTNGGGKLEKTRISDINTKLSLPLSHKISTSQLIQSHTPLRDFNHLHTSTILILGGDHDDSRLVAESYGYKTVLTSADIYHSDPQISPFSKHFSEYHGSYARPLPTPISSSAGLKIDAVMVFNDPRDWGLDCQLLIDIMLSHNGVLGTYSSQNGDKSLPNNGFQQDGQPPIYFSNPDLLWASEYPLSRLGQGGFREAVKGVWSAVTKTISGTSADLKYEILGKPYQKTYGFAERVLLEQAGNDGKGGLDTVYMIGDNPESDIKGANEFENGVAEWKSVLVKTGVFRARQGEKPSVEPDALVEDVREGVRWALKKSGWKGELE